MSDERLRELERTWRQTGAVEDEVALLRERMRVGALDEQRVRLAAWLGHPAAEQVAGPEARFAPKRGKGAEDTFWRGVLAHGEQAAVRAIVADARRATRRAHELAHGEAKPSRALTRLRAVFAADGSALDPVDHEAAGWWRAIQQIVESATAWVLVPNEEARAVLALDLTRFASGRVLPPPLLSRRRPFSSAVRDLESCMAQLAATLASRVIRPWRGLEVARLTALRATMCVEVAPWALGTGDVLRDELQGRLDRIQIASPCTADWEHMTPIGRDGRTRHCASCNLAVHDLAAYTAAEVDELLRQREGRRLCVNLYRRADGRVLTRDCPTGLSARVALPGGGGVVMRGGIG